MPKFVDKLHEVFQKQSFPEYIDNKLSHYNAQLDEAEEINTEKTDQINRELINPQIANHQKRKAFYNNLSDQLQSSGEVQISTSDPDTRHMITRNNITKVAYNVQTTVDEKNKLIIDYQVTNTNDSKAMGCLLRRAKVILGSNEFTALYDKGYHTGSEFKKANKLNIETLVAIPDIASALMAPDPR